MGKLTDTVKGTINEAVGKGKQEAGRANDDPALAAEGKTQETKGGAQKVVGKVKGALGNDI